MRSVLIFIVGLCLCYMGFYNKFPLVYPDTGAYIHSGFTNEVLQDRPIIYGLFLRHISLSESLWLVIFAQGILLAWSVYFVFKYFARSTGFTLHYLFFFLVIMLFTGVSVNVSQLIPDVFTPIAILTFIVLVFARNISRRDFIFLSILFLLSLTSHSSHFPMFGLFLLVATVVFGIRRWRKKASLPEPRKLGLAWGLLIGGWLLLCTVHASLGGGFQASKSGHVFLFARMLEMDVAKEYLIRECGNNDYKICKYIDSIPSNFIWDPQSPLYKTGGWAANKAEYNAIIGSILTTPKYLKRYLVRCMESSIKQFFYFDTGDTPPMREGSSPHGAIAWHYPEEMREYTEARQHYDLLDYTFVNYTQHLLFFISLFITLAILFSSAADRPLKNLMLLILALMLCNAVVCASLSGVVARYQSRVVWLIVLPLFIALTQKGLYRDILRSYTGKTGE